jgi:hypothetical protein
MATRDEILRDLVTRVKDLEDWRAAQQADDWDGDFDPGEPEFTVAPPSHLDDKADADLRPARGLEPAHGERVEGDPDEDTPETLEAKRRIAEANATDVPGKVHRTAVQIEPGKDGITVTVPKPTKQQLFMRNGNGKRVIANLPGIDHKVALTAYVEGGPLWLHAYNRDHVVGLPADLRQQFIKDVAMTAPEEAQQLSADILKVTGEAQTNWAVASGTDLAEREPGGIPL